MAGGMRIEDRIREIAAIAGAPGEGQVRLLREAIGSGSGALIASAARVAQRLALSDLAPDLARAFLALLDRQGKADKGCLAKAALAEALDHLGYADEEPFLRGVRYQQLEPAFGKTMDTAGRVRALCAMGLARVGHPRAAHEVLPLLVDSEPEARAAAVRALACLSGDTGELLLRLKALAGDAHPAVVGECLSALMKMDPAGSLKFVQRFLGSADLAIVEEAAMAIAASQDPRAARILCRCRTSRPDSRFREVMLVPIAMARSDEALEHLRAAITDESEPSARAAVKAAAIHRHDPRWRAGIRRAVELRDDAAVSRAYGQEFGE